MGGGKCPTLLGLDSLMIQLRAFASCARRLHQRHTRLTNPSRQSPEQNNPRGTGILSQKTSQHNSLSVAQRAVHWYTGSQNRSGEMASSTVHALTPLKTTRNVEEIPSTKTRYSINIC